MNHVELNAATGVGARPEEVVVAGGEEEARLPEQLGKGRLVVAAEAGRCDGFLLDCLTVLITNRILAREADWDNPPMHRLAEIEADVLVEIEALIAAAAGQAVPLIAVTNEVGFGIVPLSPLARFFRDCAGRANQRLAAAADEVHLVVSGIPVCIKGGRSGPCVP